MDITYKRDLNKSYMVLEGELSDTGFEEQMLRQNDIKTLLSFYTVEMNHRIQFWYDITGRKSIRDYAEQEGVSVELLSKIVFYLGIAFEEIQKYLIRQEHIAVSPDTVFIEDRNSGFLVLLCYAPFQEVSIAEQMQSIFEYMIQVVDHKNDDATELCYKLYELSVGPDFCYDMLHEAVNQIKNEDQGNIKNKNQGSIKNKDQDHIQIEKIDLREKQTDESITRPSEAAIGHDEDYLSLYGDDFEEEDTSPKRSLLQKIKEFITNKFHTKVSEAKDKGKQLNPFNDPYENVVFEPDQEIFEPTVLLKNGSEKCMGKLLYEGDKEESDHIINVDTFRIGSKVGSNDAVLHSAAVSRNHAKITRNAGHFYIEDLNSTNGTYINGNLLSYHQQMQLNMNDEIAFADVLYRII